MRHPAADARSTISNGQPNRRSRRSRSRSACETQLASARDPRAPHRCVGVPKPPGTRLATRRCQGHAPDPGSGCRAPSTRSAVARDHRRGDPMQIGADERSVAIHERDEILGGSQEAGVTRSTEATSRLGDHDGTEAACDLGRAVDGTVVDHDRRPAGGDAGEHRGKRARFVEDREDHVAHVRTTARAAVPDDATRSSASTAWAVGSVEEPWTSSSLRRALVTATT